MVGPSVGWKGGRLTKWCIGEVAVGAHVHAQDNTRKVDMHTCVMAAYEPTPRLMQVCPKTVEGDTKSRDVEDIANKETLPVEGDGCGAVAKDWGVRVVPHLHA
jgi:hypothetical protein